MRDVNAVPPGDVGAPVHDWLDAARRVLELTRSRLLNVMAAIVWKQAAPSEPLDPEPDDDSDAWALPDALPPLDLTAIDRALDADETKVI